MNRSELPVRLRRHRRLAWLLLGFALLGALLRLGHHSTDATTAATALPPLQRALRSVGNDTDPPVLPRRDVGGASSGEAFRQR
jgi:hypothetical protein